VTKAGVDEVISFAICGIFDKPDSKIPIGHPSLPGTLIKIIWTGKKAKADGHYLKPPYYENIKHDCNLLNQ